MPVSVATEWKQEMARAHVRPVDIFDLDVDGTGWTYSYCTGTDRLFGFSPQVERISGLSSSLSAATGIQTPGEVEVSLRPGSFRDVIRSTVLIGKKVRVRRGTPNLIEAHFRARFAGRIESINFADAGTISLRCKDAWSFLENGIISKNTTWFGFHPVEAIKKIYELHVPAELWDEDSMSHVLSAPDAWPWNTYRKFVADTKARDALLGLLELMDCSIVIDDSGRHSLVHLKDVLASSPARSFTEADIRQFSCDSSFDSIVNQIHFYGQPKPIDVSSLSESTDVTADTSPRFVFQHDASIEAHKYGAEAGSGIFNLDIKNEWFAPASTLVSYIRSHNGKQEVWIKDPEGKGFTGARDRFEGQTIDDILINGKLAYFKIDAEIIAVEAIRQVTSGGLVEDSDVPIGTILRHDDGSYVTAKPLDPPGLPTHYSLIYIIRQRGALGTAVAAHAPTAVIYDITPAITIAQNRATYFSYGAPEVTLEVAPEHGDLQTLDLVEFQHPSFVWRGLGEAEMAVALVLGVDDIDGATRLRLRYLRAQSGTGTHVNISDLLDRAPGRFTDLEGLHATSTSDWTVGGLQVVQRSGLNVSLSSGTIRSPTQTLSIPESTIPVIASSSQRILLSAAGEILSVPILSPTPPGFVAIAEYESDDSEVTSTTDVRPTELLNYFGGAVTIPTGTKTVAIRGLAQSGNTLTLASALGAFEGQQSIAVYDASGGALSISNPVTIVPRSGDQFIGSLSVVLEFAGDAATFRPVDSGLWAVEIASNVILERLTDNEGEPLSDNNGDPIYIKAPSSAATTQQQLELLTDNDENILTDNNGERLYVLVAA